jgi:cobaltochelatase CobS
MKARFVTNCKTCSSPIAIGEEITWARRGQHKGTHHAACYQPMTQTTKPIETKTEDAIATKPTDTQTIDGLPLDNYSLAQTLARTLEPFLTIQRDELTAELEEKLSQMIEESIANLPLKTKTVFIQQGRTIGEVTEQQHEHFELVYKLVQARINVFLWGEAGSGKSSAAREIAKSLKLPFYYLALQAQTPESRLMGYMDANGNYVETDFYRAYKHGGIFLLDELALGNGNLLGSLNGALANGLASFPCGQVERHPDFICIATDNTPGLGATKAYCDRRALDASVRDRFYLVQWDTDKALEHALAANHFEHAPKWVNWVQAIRNAAQTVSPSLIVTQRASIEGSRMLAAGLDVANVAEGMVFRGFDRVSVGALLARHPLPVF